MTTQLNNMIFFTINEQINLLVQVLKINFENDYRHDS